MLSCLVCRDMRRIPRALPRHPKPRDAAALRPVLPAGHTGKRTSDGSSVAAQASVEIEIHSQSVCIVTLRGEHDAASSEAVTLALAAARGYDNILVDLAQCTFIDSTLITALLVSARRAQQVAGALELVLPNESNAVRRTLEIANVQMILPFHATRVAAIAAVTASDRQAGAVRPDVRVLTAKSGAERRPGTVVIRATVVEDGISIADAEAVERLPASPHADGAWGGRAA
jgi:anti-anti-sigma factor